MKKLFVGLGILVILFGVIFAWYFYTAAMPTTPTGTQVVQTNTGNNTSIYNTQSTSSTTSAASGTISATITPSAVATSSRTPTITGTYANTYGLEILITSATLPTSGLLSNTIPGLVWEDRSDHGGGVILNNPPSGTFSNTVTTPLKAGTYNVGVYFDTIYYPQTDENIVKDYRELLNSSTIQIQ